MEVCHFRMLKQPLHRSSKQNFVSLLGGEQVRRLLRSEQFDLSVLLPRNRKFHAPLVLGLEIRRFTPFCAFSERGCLIHTVSECLSATYEELAQLHKQDIGAAKRRSPKGTIFVPS